MASNYPGVRVHRDPAVPEGMIFAVPLKERWIGPDGRVLDPRDWGFDEIYPTPPAPRPLFEQVEAWDRDRRRAGQRPWIEPSAELHGLRNISSALKDHYLDAIRYEMNRGVLLWGASREITAGTKMLEDMRRYSSTAPHRRALAAIKNFRGGWRRALALRLAPELQEDY